jgi:hypothetical protein
MLGTSGAAGGNGGAGLESDCPLELLRRDLGHGNDHSPMWINAAA